MFELAIKKIKLKMSINKIQQTFYLKKEANAWGD